MENIPASILLAFTATTLFSILIFYKAAHHSKKFLVLMTIWMILQTIISLSGFYTVTDSIPPRFALLLVPALLMILVLFITSGGRKFLDGLDQKYLTILHNVRIPVEFILYWIFLHKGIPKEMTFEGRNFDILSGLSAPVIYYLAYKRKLIGNRIVLIWNLICLVLLINIVGMAIVSAPFPFQQMAFDQPNIGVLYFPFTWLPCCIVPLVLLSHLAQIRQILLNKSGTSKIKTVKTELI